MNPFSGVLSHQILGTGCYWWPSLEYFIAGVQITCPKVGFKFPSACCWSNFQMTSQPLRTNLSLVLSICFYPIPASLMIWGLGICVYPLEEHVFNCYPGRWKDWHGSTCPIQDSFHFPACSAAAGWPLPAGEKEKGAHGNSASAFVWAALAVSVITLDIPIHFAQGPSPR